MESNKFGMFIHWGIYAMTGLHEQAFARFGMQREEYESLAQKFNPQLYDPEEWVLLAKEAGMEYICFTAKHHDGFCMWDTKHTDYSIMHTPYGKDVLKMLSDACAKHGMKLSIYYSCPDWHHPDAYNPNSTHQWKAVRSKQADFARYRDYLIAQTTELLTNYGSIYTWFWDIPPQIFDPEINELVRKLQPGIFINDRGFDKGDFSTPERDYDIDGATTRYPRMTEACNAIDVQSWGYRTDTDYYSYRNLLSSVSMTMARGGSYLLNVGPRADGTIDPAHAQRIRKVGDWYRRMQGSLVSHRDPETDCGVNPGGSIAVEKDGKLYLHWPDGVPVTGISLKNVTSLPKSARLLNLNRELTCRLDILPENYDGDTGCTGKPYLHIFHIPADEIGVEPACIEIVW